MQNNPPFSVQSGDCLARWAQIQPERIALTDGDRNVAVSYLAAHQITERVATWLRQLGITNGDRVALLAPNEFATHFLFFACQRLGAILVPLNFRLTSRELEPLLEDCSPRILICHEELWNNIPGDWLTNKLALHNFSELDKICFFNQSPSNPDSTAAINHENFVAWENPVMILYTSGTTGRAKGALITGKMLFWNAMSTAMRLGISANDTALSFLPLFHTSGWNVLTTPFLQFGAQIVFLRKFCPERILDLCAQHRVSILFGVPTTMARMANAAAFSQIDLSSVRFAIVGGEAMPIPLIEKWASKGIPIRQGYGLTEFGPNVFSLNEKDSLRKKGSIGLPNFFIDTRLVDDSGKDVSPGELGELLLRGPACTPGYWQNPQATQAAFAGEWFRTGDILRQDAEGYFFVVDRKKDMFISGGENIYPSEIEQLLRQHPAVAEVAVVGEADPKWGEVGAAYVVLKAHKTVNAPTLRHFCEGKLARYKIPQYFYFLEELPKGDSGKILKRALRAGKSDIAIQDGLASLGSGSFDRIAANRTQNIR